MFRLVILLFVLLPLPGQAEEVCGQTAAPCSIESGTYRMAVPEGAPPEGGWPAMMFFHGAGGSGARTLSNSGMVERFLNRGYAVIAPDGLERPNSRFGPMWSFHPDRPEQRDESAYTRAVIEDAAARFTLDKTRILLSGFSIGGSLVWYMACEEPDLAAAYAPVAGAFWRPEPGAEACAGPIKLFHTHGWRDQVVPLEGRPLGGGQIYQGDVFTGLETLRALNGCDGMRADVFDTEGAFWRRAWEACAPGTALELALHTGGHTVPIGWSNMALDWFEGLEITSAAAE